MLCKEIQIQIRIGVDNPTENHVPNIIHLNICYLNKKFFIFHQHSFVPLFFIVFWGHSGVGSHLI